MAVPGVSRSPYLALGFGAMVIVWVQLARNSKLTSGEKRAAAVASVVVLLTVAFVGELSPQVATGFAGLLFLAILLGGTDATAYLFQTIPQNLIDGAKG